MFIFHTQQIHINTNMSKVFQVISIDFKNPLTGEVKKNCQFLGLAPFTLNELREFKKTDASVGDFIQDIRVFSPENPLDYVDEIPEMRDLINGISELGDELSESDNSNAAANNS